MRQGKGSSKIHGRQVFSLCLNFNMKVLYIISPKGTVAYVFADCVGQKPIQDKTFYSKNPRRTKDSGPISPLRT
jgi:hypothetical protein